MKCDVFSSQQFKLNFILSVCILGVFMMFNNPVSAQNSSNFSLGIRAGDPTGITGKYFLSENKAIEGIVSFWPFGPAFTGLYEIHANAFNVDGLYWFYGGGLHLRIYRGGWYRYDYWGWYYPNRRYTTGIGIGIDGIVGMEYRIPPIPITVGVDIKPTFELATNNRSYFAFEPAISLRFRF